MAELDYENLPTEELQLRLRELAASTPARMAECRAAIPIIVERLERRRAKERAVAPPVPVAKDHDHNQGWKQGLKQVYQEILKSVLRIATPDQRIELLAREHAALTRRDAPSTDGTDLVERIRSVFDREDLTDEIVELAVSTEPPSLPLPPPNATPAQPVEQAGAVRASAADAPPNPGFVRQREDKAPQLPQQAPWLLLEDKTASAARLKEWFERLKRDRQDAAATAGTTTDAQAERTAATDIDDLKAERKRLRDDYKAECKKAGVKVTDAMIAQAASERWSSRDNVQKWLACDKKYDGTPDRLIRNVFAKKPHPAK